HQLLLRLCIPHRMGKLCVVISFRGNLDTQHSLICSKYKLRLFFYFFLFLMFFFLVLPSMTPPLISFSNLLYYISYFLYCQASTRDFVSRAIINSSLVAITITLTLESSVDITWQPPRTSFFSGSILIPNCSKPSMMSA